MSDPLIDPASLGTVLCLVGATGLGCVLASIEFSKAMTAWAFYVVTVLGLILRLLSA